MIFLQLFWEFFKTGLFSIGGGLATIPFLRDMADRTGWFTEEELTNFLAISESTPGPIGVNMSTYVGYNTAGFLGSLCSTLGLIMPGIICIILIAAFLNHFQKNKLVVGAFSGLRPASVALITSATISVAMLAILNGAAVSFAEIFKWPAVLYALALIVLTNVFEKIHPAFFIVMSAVVGIIFKFA